MQARYYDPVIGRFLSTDPIGYEGGENLYAYVGNDPVNATDPSGLAAQESQVCYARSGWHIKVCSSGGSSSGGAGWVNAVSSGPTVTAANLTSQDFPRAFTPTQIRQLQETAADKLAMRAGIYVKLSMDSGFEYAGLVFYNLHTGEVRVSYGYHQEDPNMSDPYDAEWELQPGEVIIMTWHTHKTGLKKNGLPSHSSHGKFSDAKNHRYQAKRNHYLIGSFVINIQNRQFVVMDTAAALRTSGDNIESAERPMGRIY